MRENFNKEILGVGAGLATVELGPEVVQNVFAELGDASGANINFSPAEIPDLNIGAIVEGAQSVALPLATASLLWLGLKKMTQGWRQSINEK